MRSAPCFNPYDDGGTPDDDSDDIPGELDFCDVPTLGKNRTVLGQLVGASSYDIGHIVLGVNGGGIAYLAVPGGDYKGGACTGLPDPVGDFMALDYVAHEMGHQFGGNHTFNGAIGACGGNISEASVEPGSGSSVMAYAGICGQDDLQPHTDPYFSWKTIEEATAYTSADPYQNVEVQTVSLSGFSAGESITLGYGAASPVVIPFADYNAADLDTAISSLTGTEVSIAQWGFDEFGYDPTVLEPDATGFQVIFNDEPSILGADETDVDLESLTVTSTDPGVSGFVGETAQGGPSFNQGISTDTDDNHAPAVTAPADKTLPMQTPFALTGTGTDADGDSLIYLWEQSDFGDEDGTPLATNGKTNGPIFRVFGKSANVTEEGTLETPSPGLNIADGSPSRTFPDLDQILSGNTNAVSGTCTAPAAPEDALTPEQLECFSEYLPTSGYVGSVGSETPAMHFRLTARDLDPTGGGTAYDDVTLTLDPATGPFLVTSQATSAPVAGGVPVPVTWAVNGTQALAANVRISLSTDGGLTYPTVLASSTANDGSAQVTLPNTATSTARLRIDAVDNYFFDINKANFAIAPSAVPNTTVTDGPRNGAIVLDSSVRYVFNSTVSPSTFDCKLDGRTVACPDSKLQLRRLAAGTHTVTAAARTATGAVDPTPAIRTFTVPIDDPKLKAKGGWDRRMDRDAFGSDVSVSRKKGSSLRTTVQNAKRLVLVVSTSPGYGTVKVLIGKKAVGQVKLRGAARSQVLKTVRLGKATSGTVRIVNAGNREVRIEGLAVLTN